MLGDIRKQINHPKLEIAGWFKYKIMYTIPVNDLHMVYKILKIADFLPIIVYKSL